MEFDYAKHNALPDHFPDRLEGAPPKLWVGWLYRPNLKGELKWIRRDVEFLFGKDWQVRLFRRLYMRSARLQPGKMEVFKNTPAWNERLWRVKHLIELRPLTFPNGEPTADDVGHLRVHSDGRCVVDKRLAVDPAALRLADPRKQMTSKYLSQQSMRLWHLKKDVHEDTVYTPSNISITE